ncbi:MAG: CvpA family protein [Breznakibacter sp.]
MTLISYIDIIAGGVLLFALIRGFVNGFILELTSTVAFILGVLGAVMIGSWAESFLSQWVQWPYLGIVAFLSVFMIVVLLAYFLGNTVTNILKNSILSFFNRLLGGIFSLLKYAFLISVIVAVINFFDSGRHVFPENKTKQSHLYPYLEQFAPSIFPYLHFSSANGFINL